MNTYSGNITAVETDGALSIVTVNVSGIQLSTIVVDSPESAPYLAVGKVVNVVFKETEVVLATGNPDISLANQIAGVVKSVDTGAILSRIEMQTVIGLIVSIITTRSVHRLGIKPGDQVMAMVKTNETMLS